MSLIQCPECRKDVSNRADKCIHCGYPLTTGTIVAQPASVQTIELTAKKWKVQQLVAAGLMVVGVIVLVLGLGVYSNDAVTVLGAVLLAVGLIWSVIVRGLIWWHHE
jgi:uncharacterized membrane protein YvbJ